MLTATYKSVPYYMSIDFSDEDLLLGFKLHNRPFYVSGYVREQRVHQILIENGSVVNIMSKSTMRQLGILIDELLNSKLASNPPILCYVPLSRCKKRGSLFMESPKGLKVGDIKLLKESFTTPLTKITKEEIKIDLMEVNLAQRWTEDGFNPKAYKLMAKAGYDFTTHAGFKSLKIHEQQKLSLTQKKLLREGHAIPVSRKGLRYKSSESVNITRKRKKKAVDNNHITIVEVDNMEEKRGEGETSCHHITIVEESEIETPEEGVKDVPQSLEDGDQSTIDELKEMNLGTIEEPQETFINASLSSKEEDKYASLLTEYRDIFAWSYKEMPEIDPKVAVHHLVIKQGYRSIKQGQRHFRPKLIP
ncbi:uncharacterized protein E5676_scaffold403G00450 [Cucumis melo var. makuwa]|uniref:Ty3-gypsy retrotransposon protein n=1 Tax=Cucumis melo var. makuwa TaxID=1194695 RepID=A0A5D3DZG5_CUCMM|nr:uncharacterized protein E5676_scaffold403G00450 [Cucumis melo var. makuwa]